MKNFITFVSLCLTAISASPLGYDTSVPLRLTKRDPRVGIVHQDNNIQGPNGQILSIQDELNREMIMVTEFAFIAISALHDPAITDHPAYLTIFGTQNNRDAAVEHLTGLSRCSHSSYKFLTSHRDISTSGGSLFSRQLSPRRSSSIGTLKPWNCNSASH